MSDNNSPHERQPLVTFAVFAYNQEKFIREAVAGALCQTYSPLEIILSDDCSCDRTFELMKEMADAYRGPHQIILNRNVRNLHIREHVNVVVSRSKGVWIVMAAGDDVSIPERTEVLIQASNDYTNPKGVGSALAMIDITGKVLGTTAKEETPLNLSLQKQYRTIVGTQIKGATAMWHRSVFCDFGQLKPPSNYEDLVLTMRACFLGDVIYLSNRELVKYRCSGLTSSPVRWNELKNEEAHKNLLLGHRDVIDSIIADSDTYMAIDCLKAGEMIEQMAMDRTILDTCIQWWDTGFRRRQAIIEEGKIASWPDYLKEWVNLRCSPKWWFISTRMLNRIILIWYSCIKLMARRVLRFRIE